LRRLGWWLYDGPRAEDEALLWALSRAPDPDLALRSLSRLRDVTAWGELHEALSTDLELRGRLFGLLGSSTALADHVVAAPHRWRMLTGEDVDYATTLLAAVGGDMADGGGQAGLTGIDAIRALRAGYLDLLGQLAAADLAAVVEHGLPVLDLSTVGRRLADLADAALRAALAVATTEVLGGGEPGCRLAVIAMGKCGGQELNYVSDVDVVFVAEPEAELTQASRIAAAMMRIAGAACFQVDAALRPEGRAGALVRTVDSYRDYYRRWAHTWEFQALLKARPVAGDAELGQAYVDTVTSAVWAAADRKNFVADVQAMRKRVEDQVPSTLVDRELKLGRGGLRDVEFAVQLLQLVHGRSEESLRVGSTVEALRALGRGGFVGRDDSANLAASYEFLRLLEHRLQLRRLRRTHLLPAE
jgi:glutamate-ammonia-ligase adenylyltransferase